MRFGALRRNAPRVRAVVCLWSVSEAHTDGRPLGFYTPENPPQQSRLCSLPSERRSARLGSHVESQHVGLGASMTKTPMEEMTANGVVFGGVARAAPA